MKQMTREFLADFFRTTESKANTMKQYKKLGKTAMLVDTDMSNFDFVGPFDNEGDARRYRLEESGWEARSVKIVSYEKFKAFAPRMCV